ncbi:MAG TPA: hypothetical protein VN673_11950, partial [Clostridia bacterium]|nr:hypothetical protein [Clostridia bacterium]
EQNRSDVLSDPEADRRLAYRHSGRFDSEALPWLDSRTGILQGDQFNYRRNRDGSINGNCREALAPGEFQQMLESVEANLKRMGEEVLAGIVAVSPYRKGSVTACDHCDYGAICRMDPWKHSFRILSRDKAASKQGASLREEQGALPAPH